VLLDERHRCKIADFGLARESDSAAGEAFYQARGARHLPVRPSRVCLVLASQLGHLLDLQVLPFIQTLSHSPSREQVRWIAAEALDKGAFTTASDVWAYGITRWEIVHFARTPYPGMTNATVSACTKG
jgi:serine/threonine protein kinase